MAACVPSPGEDATLGPAVARTSRSRGHPFGRTLRFDERPRNVPSVGGSTMMALATFALGMAIFALFFGLVAACDRL